MTETQSGPVLDKPDDGKDAAGDSAAGQTIRAFPNLSHVGIVVRDAGKAARDLIRQFDLDGSALVTDLMFKVEGAIYKGKAVDFSAHVTIVELGNSQIEYLAPVEGESPYADALADGRESCVHHVAHVVDSIDELLERAQNDNREIDLLLDARIRDSGRYVYVGGIVPGTLVEYIEIRTTSVAA